MAEERLWSFVVADRDGRTARMLDLVRQPGTERPLTEEDVRKAKEQVNGALKKLGGEPWEDFRIVEMTHREAVTAGLLPGVDVVRFP
jgi:hypothetical protein